MPVTIRGKIAKGILRKTRYEEAPFRGVRPPLSRRIMGRKAMLRWHREVDNRIREMEHYLHQNRETLIDGNIRLPPGLKRIKKSHRIDIVCASAIMGSMGSLIGGATDRKTAVSAAIIGAGIGAFWARGHWYRTMIKDYKGLIRMLKTSHLFVSREGKPLNRNQVEQNTMIVEGILRALLNMSSHNSKAIEGLQA
ncbi:MAG: hypothetical protein V1776_01050 [Candidatus Diapherotrites archaeon]